MTAQRRPVLVVDDDAVVREMVVLMLEDAGYQVVAAGDGHEALEQVSQEMPALILLDMRMPRMNGWEFARVFRERHNHHAPIIVLTAAEDARQRAADARAEGYLGKPFNLDELILIVERHIGPVP